MDAGRRPGRSQCRRHADGRDRRTPAGHPARGRDPRPAARRGGPRRADRFGAARTARLLPASATSCRPGGDGPGRCCAGVDGLTAVNQAHTHAAWDRVLTAVSSAWWRPSVPSTVARVAGDEFVILLPDIICWRRRRCCRAPAGGCSWVGGDRVARDRRVDLASGSPWREVRTRGSCFETPRRRCARPARSGLTDGVCWTTGREPASSALHRPARPARRPRDRADSRVVPADRARCGSTAPWLATRRWRDGSVPTARWSSRTTSTWRSPPDQ